MANDREKRESKCHVCESRDAGSEGEEMLGKIMVVTDAIGKV